MIDDNTATVEERYVAANQSSNLRLETGEDAPLGDAAVLIAAGWSASRIGAALMRLHTRIDRSGLEQVHEQIMMQAQYWGIERPASVSAAVLSWWLRRVCGTCHGVRLEAIADTPSLSSRPCKTCKGTGEAKLAYGHDGRRLADWLDNCKVHAAASIKKRLQNTK
jgi:hypothetical protein